MLVRLVGDEATTIFQLLELVLLPLAKNWQKEINESTVASKT